MAMICGICADGLCEDHERDCMFDGTMMTAIGGPCACPNSRNPRKDTRMSTERFHWTSPAGTEVTLPKMGQIPGGLLRKNRKLDPVDLLFTIVETVCDDTVLDKLDSLPMDDLNKLFEAWQDDTGTTVGESSGSSI